MPQNSLGRSRIREHAQQLGFGFIVRMLISGLLGGAVAAWICMVIVMLITDPPVVFLALIMSVFVVPAGAFAGAVAAVGGLLGHLAASRLGARSAGARVVAVGLGAGIVTSALVLSLALDGTSTHSFPGGPDQYITWVALATILSGGHFWFALRWRVRHPRQLAPALTGQYEESAG